VQVQADLFAAFEKKRVRKDRNEPQRKQIDAEIDWAENTIKKELAKADKSNVSAAMRYADMVAGWDPYDQNASSPFFDPEWMFNNKDGFDVVIGNPPYVKLETIKDQSRILEAEGYEVFEKRSDLYCLFTERGIKLLSNGGVISFIMSNKWLQAEYGKPLRCLMRKYMISSLIDFGDIQIFDGATTYPCIFNLLKDQPTAGLDALVLKSFSHDSFSDYVRNNRKRFPADKLTNDAWVIELDDLELLERIWKLAIPLSDYVGGEAYYGIKPGTTAAFIVDESTKNTLIKEDAASRKILHPVVRGRDIARYYVSSACMWLVGTHNGYGRVPYVNINGYPAIKKWLNRYKLKLASRTDSGRTIYNLRDCAYWEKFQCPKIMYQKFQVHPCFVYDKTGLYCNDSMWIIPTEEIGLVGLLNSKMGWWLISKYCTQIQNGYQLIWQYLSKIPVPKALPSTLGGLVEKIISMKKADSNADTSALESQIDQLVYKLYGLTEEEIAIVEGRGGGRGVSDLPDGDDGHAGRGALPGDDGAKVRRRGVRVPAAAVEALHSDDDEELE